MIDPTRILSRLGESFARQTLMTTFGARLIEAADGRCVIEAPILPIALQHHGFGHAGLTFALGDTAAGYAAGSLMPEDAQVLTVEMKINLLAPARGDLLRATGRIVRAGKRLTVVAADVTALADGRETAIAVLQGTMMPVGPT